MQHLLYNSIIESNKSYEWKVQPTIMQYYVDPLIRLSHGIAVYKTLNVSYFGINLLELIKNLFGTTYIRIIKDWEEYINIHKEIQANWNRDRTSFKFTIIKNNNNSI